MSERTKKDRRGREALSARMTGVSPEQVAEAIATAQSAWDNDRLVHLYMPGALTGLDSEGLGEAVDAIIRIGWRLQSTALSMQTTGPNRQQALFVFVRT